MAGGVEFLSYRCLHAPLAVGNFILKPNQRAFSDMMDMLSAGFTPERGWGLRDLKIGPDGWHLNCDDPGWESKAYCADRNTSRWDFLGAEGDKGLLFTEYSAIRRAFRTLKKSDYTQMTKSYNFFGPIKPWMPIKRCEILSDANHWNLHPVGHIPQFWELYEKYSRSKMIATEPLYCVSDLDRSWASFRSCLSAVHI
ncbi:unnamed protein product [Symbiodinium necroappetens]|uniref:Uncharacterized protein n=1 Tax=Symbiodinium necroappetens TaxID=1628268 RepID=A0A813BQM3_9DINO|nr:unnamed protein product [Symbiodinium necroappetens]